MLLLSPVHGPLTCSSVFNSWGRWLRWGKGVSQTQTQSQKGTRQKGGVRIVTNWRAEYSDCFSPKRSRNLDFISNVLIFEKRVC